MTRIKWKQIGIGISAGILVIISSGCSTVYQPERVQHVMEQSVRSAKQHVVLGQPAEATQLITAVRRVDPTFPELDQISDQSVLSDQRVYNKPMLGSNKASRQRAERSKAARIWLYLPDRFLDFLDIVTFDVHAGPSFFVNSHVTRAAQAGIGGRAVGGIGWHNQRSLGLQYQTEGGVAVLPFGAQGHAIGSVGTSGLRASYGGVAGLHRPSSEIYQEYRDYWAIGGSLSLFIGADVDIHPLQIADFFAGWAVVDFLNDDFAETKGLRLSKKDLSLLKQMEAFARSPNSIMLYEAKKKELSLEEKAAETETP